MTEIVEPKLSKPEEEAIAIALHTEARAYVAPIWWGSSSYDAYSVLHNASCFFVEVGKSRFGVTANHVIYGNRGDGTGGYLADRDKHKDCRLMIRNTDLGRWEDRVIDSDPGLDVTTFRVSDDEFGAIGCRPFISAADKWPPSPPGVGKGVFIAGYPGAERRILSSKGVEFAVETNGLVLTSFDNDELEVLIDRADLEPTGGVPVPPMTKDLGGYSGGPLLIVSAEPLGPLFWLGGVVFRQLRAKDENDTTTLWARRPTRIRADGTLIRTRDYSEAGSAPPP